MKKGKRKTREEKKEVELLDKALKFLSYRPRTSWEIKSYLRRKKAKEEAIERILKRLKKLDFVNDKDFCLWFIEQRTKFRPRGIRFIESELRQKGIERKTIEEAFEEVDSNELELKNARQGAERFRRKRRNLKGRDLENRLYQYLMRLGFRYEIIKTVVDEEKQKE